MLEEWWGGKKRFSLFHKQDEPQQYPMGGGGESSAVLCCALLCAAPQGSVLDIPSPWSAVTVGWRQGCLGGTSPPPLAPPPLS